MIQDGNLWKGLVSYTEEDVIEGRYIFSGRRDITLALLSMVKNNLLVTLYGKSGIGKTSMLQAGLFPLLRRDNYLPVLLRPAEIDYDNFDEYVIETVKDQLKKHNVTRYVAGKDGRFNQKTDNDTDDSVGNIALWFASSKFYDSDMREVFPVLVFDQFEALFIGRRDKGSEVLRGLHTMIDDSELQCPESVVCHNEANFRIMLVVREDDLFRLEDAIDELGYRSMKDNRLRLRALTDAQAREVIEKPVDELKSKTGFSLIPDDEREEVIKRIIDISRNRSGKVDSAILSLVCSELYSLANGGVINLNAVGRIAKNPLGDFYNKAVANLKDKELGFIESLVDEQGRRRTVFRSNVNKYIKKPSFLFTGQYKLLQNVPGTKPSDGNPDNQPVELVHDLIAKAVFDSRNHRKRSRLKDLMSFFCILLFGLVFTAICFHRDTNIPENKGGYVVADKSRAFSYYGRPDIDSIYVKTDSVFDQVGYFSISQCSRLKKIVFENTSKGVDKLRIYISDCPSLTELVLPDSLVKSININVVNTLNIGPIMIAKDVECLEAKINIDKEIVNCKALIVDKCNANYRYDQGVLWDLKNKDVSLVTHKVEKACFPVEMKDVIISGNVKNIMLCCVNKASGTQFLFNTPTSIVGKFANPEYTDTVDLSATGAQHIDKNSFADCRIKGVVFPMWLEDIGEAAFINCDNLESIYLPDHLKCIGSYAFADCDNLTEVSVNANTYIKRNAFEGSPNVILKVRDDNDGERIFKRDEPYWPWRPITDNDYFRRNVATEFTGLKDAGIYFGEKDLFEYYNGRSNYFEYKDAFNFKGTDIITASDNYTQYAVYHKGQNKVFFLPKAKAKGFYSFLGERPVDLQEIYLPISSPYRTLSDGKIDRQYTRKIVLADSFKRNITLYVPEGCSKNFVDVPEYQGFKAIKEMSGSEMAMIKIGYYLNLRALSTDRIALKFAALGYFLVLALLIAVAIYPIKHGLTDVAIRQKRFYVLQEVLSGAVVAGCVFFGVYLALTIFFSIKIVLSVSIAVVTMLVSEICFYYLPLPRGERMPPWLKKLLRRKGRSDNAIID